MKFLHVIPKQMYRLLSTKEKLKSNKNKIKSNIEKMSGLTDCMNFIHKNIIDLNLEAFGGKTRTLDVHCMSLNSVFEKNNLSNVHLLSIDSEGSELKILEAFDFTKYNIEVITIEVLYPDKKLSNLLKKNGYKFIKRIGYDRIYKKL